MHLAINKLHILKRDYFPTPLTFKFILLNKLLCYFALIDLCVVYIDTAPDSLK